VNSACVGLYNKLLSAFEKVCIKFPVSKLNCLDCRSSYKVETPRTHRLMHINNTFLSDTIFGFSHPQIPSILFLTTMYQPVAEFSYLGSTSTSQNIIHEEIKM
jgi:hypothetical protein